MLRQMFLIAAVVALVGPLSAQEQKQAQEQPKPILQVQIRNSAAYFKANFDLAARSARPAPLAPGSAEVP